MSGCTGPSIGIPATSVTNHRKDDPLRSLIPLLCGGAGLLAEDLTPITGDYPIFRIDEPVELAVAATAAGADPLGARPLRWSVRDRGGAIRAEGEERVDLDRRGPGAGWVRVQPDLPPGWFRITWALGPEDGPTADPISQDFAVLPRQPAPPPAGGCFAVSDIYGLDSSSPSLDDHGARALALAGAFWTRAFVGWQHVQPEENAPNDWRRMDQLLDAAERYGIHVLPMLGLCPPWAVAVAATPHERMTGVGARVRTSASIPRPEAWNAFLDAFCARYASRVTHVEIWNGANAVGFWPNGDAQTYARFLIDSAQRVRAAAPHLQVVLAGISGMKEKWLAAVAHADGAPAIDVVNAHPYRLPSAPRSGATRRRPPAMAAAPCSRTSPPWPRSCRRAPMAGPVPCG